MSDQYAGSEGKDQGKGRDLAPQVPQPESNEQSNQPQPNQFEIGPATEAVAFDPFTDDDEEDTADNYFSGSNAAEEEGPEEEGAEPGTSAVTFNPFAHDDEDDDDEFDLSSLLAGTTSVTQQTQQTQKAPYDPSAESHRRALNTFRQRRGDQHRARAVADGMVHLPFLPPSDPRDAVLDDDAIAKTNKPKPSLSKGDIVAGQYEIIGPIAHGGLGWIYLAMDHNVSDRWVVLKGMMAASDDRSAAVVRAEREFLAEITHPDIVKIINFIDAPDSGAGMGFIVMEYVGGPSLRRFKRSFPGSVLPVDLAVGYILELLPALDYLHSRGVVYNDFKPDNVLISEDQVTIIDVGAVSGIGAYGHIYGTPGFQAPEIAKTGPTVASDVYTIGRTLASLIIHLPSTNGVYDPGIPSPSVEPLFRRYYSLYRFITRACDLDPERRFGSAEEMQRQLAGVLREILAIRDGAQFPQRGSYFSPQRSTYGTKHRVFRTDQLVDGIPRAIAVTPQEVTAALPVPLINPEDPGAKMMNSASFAEPNELIETLKSARNEPEYANSVDIPLGIVRAQLDLGLIEQARQTLHESSDRLRTSWRYRWYEGITWLLLDQYHNALQSFYQVLGQLPGEPAPKLAMAATLELIQQQMGISRQAVLNAKLVRHAANLDSETEIDPEAHNILLGQDWVDGPIPPETIRFNALRLYSVVWATNPTTVSSAFGLARQLTAEGQYEAAISQLDKVPTYSRHHRMAKLTTVLLLTAGPATSLSESRIRRAARRLSKLPTNEPRLAQIRTAVMVAALNWLRTNKLDHASSDKMLFDVPFSVAGLRGGLESELRGLARLSTFSRHRYLLVDIANLIRPRTWR